MRKSQRRIVVRRSGIHGKGVFAQVMLEQGSRIIEYKGERISDDECEAAADPDSAHTFLFMLDDEQVIDGSRNGNTARWLNHSCNPNCEAVEEEGRIFIEALNTIEPGDELTISYNLHLEERHTAALKRLYACGCQTDACRGTLLASKR